MFTHSNNHTPQSGAKFCCSRVGNNKRNIIAYLVYIITIVIHYLIAFTWLYFTGTIGLVIMMGHWFLFNGCFISHLERWVHLKLVNKSYVPDTWSNCFIKKQLNKWKR